MQIDFTNVATIFGQPQKLLFMSSGYYCILIGKYVSTDGTVCGSKAAETVLYTSFYNFSNHKREKMLLKLHRQFSHAPFNHLKNLLKDAEMDIGIQEDTSTSRYWSFPSSFL